MSSPKAEPTLQDVIDKIDHLAQDFDTKLDGLARDVDNKIDGLARDVDEQINTFKLQLDVYEKGMRWVVNLAFGLIASATITVLITTLFKN
ncbi:hypothetical protein AWQ21_11020 [Picosynechococcus sp. PCC 7003]|uniref:hypothetical protein n=1 Tax=Picosynechococcus sp. PCC 7003 TaxID=374981 RepID=UPI00081034C7|nr:hypothetical protein [Picosynechococcus sp. PCC 7003]ANV84863.1 hypothetical protein AWQ21_11020 [Picosynechococcus sp. PCC 7003]